MGTDGSVSVHRLSDLVFQPDDQAGGDVAWIRAPGHGSCAIGVWRSNVERANAPLRWTSDHAETVLVLRGNVAITAADGDVLHLGPGDIASFPPGEGSDWVVDEDVLEFFVEY